MYSSTKPSQIFMQTKYYQQHIRRVIDIHSHNPKQKSKSKRSRKNQKSQQQRNEKSKQKVFSPLNFKNRASQYYYQSAQDLYLKNLQKGRQGARYRETQQIMQGNIGQIIRLLNIDQRNPEVSFVQTSRSTKYSQFNRSQHIDRQSGKNRKDQEQLNTQGIAHNSYYRWKAQFADINRENQSMMKRIIQCKPQVHQLQELNQEHKKNKKYKNLHRKLPIIQKYKRIYQSNNTKNSLFSNRNNEKVDQQTSRQTKFKYLNCDIIENKKPAKIQKDCKNEYHNHIQSSQSQIPKPLIGQQQLVDSKNQLATKIQIKEHNNDSMQNVPQRKQCQLVQIQKNEKPNDHQQVQAQKNRAEAQNL